MNWTSVSQVRLALDGLGVRPNRGMGQNFLVDRNILNIILDAAQLSPSDQVLEIGPGLGVLTDELSTRVARVVAIEKDHVLSGALQVRYPPGHEVVELIRDDALDTDLGSVLRSGITKVVSNLPYSVGSRILIELMRGPHAPGRMVVTVQQEVADRLVAHPGTKLRGLISVWAQLDYRASIVKKVSRTCFWPRPDVGSAIVLLERTGVTHIEDAARSAYYDLTKHAFSHRRKQIRSILSALPEWGGRAAVERCLQTLAIAPELRPEALTIADWCQLATLAASS